MENEAPEILAGHLPVRVTADSHFAWLRTRMSLERTMMAWVRTAVALIGFGFTIVQFFERLNAMEGVEATDRPFAARYVGLVLIAAGICVLVISGWQYRLMERHLWHGDFAKVAGVASVRRTPVYAITIAMTFIGVFAFLVVLVRAV